ncbi:MAG: fructokinase, partial [Verrucomicrobiales bacterium]|nr:fructokinase [Verrucomicrobiales bacterium]
IDVPEPEKFIVPPGLGAQAGVLGSLALAQDMLK